MVTNMICALGTPQASGLFTCLIVTQPSADFKPASTLSVSFEKTSASAISTTTTAIPVLPLKPYNQKGAFMKFDGTGFDGMLTSSPPSYSLPTLLTM